MSNIIYVDEINSLTTGSTITVNNNNVVGVPSGANQILAASSSGNMSWQDSYGYLRTGSGALKIDNNTPADANYILITSSGSNASWQPFSLEVKKSVKVATTSDGTLASAFQNGSVVDGYTLVTNDRILIRAQTTATENGIYSVNASGAPTRTTDFAAGDTIGNAYVFTEAGTVNNGVGFVCFPGLIGTDNMIWDIFTSDMARNYIAYVNTTTGFLNAITLGVKHIKLGPGTFTLSQAVVVNIQNCIIEGSGDATNIVCSVTVFSLFTVQASGIMFKNMKISDTTGGNTYAISVNAQNFTLDNVKFFEISGLYTVYINANNAIIKNCKFEYGSLENIFSSIYLDSNAGSASIDNVNITYNQNNINCIYVKSSKVFIKNSTITGNEYTTGINIASTSCNNIVISNNSLTSHNCGINIQSGNAGAIIVNNNYVNSKTNVLGSQSILNNNVITSINNDDYIVNINFGTSTNVYGIQINNNYITSQYSALSSTKKMFNISRSGANSFKSAGCICNNLFNSINNTINYNNYFVELNENTSSVIVANNNSVVNIPNMQSAPTMSGSLYTLNNNITIPFNTATEYNLVVNEYITKFNGINNYIIVSPLTTLAKKVAITYGYSDNKSRQYLTALTDIIIIRNTGIGTSLYSYYN